MRKLFAGAIYAVSVLKSRGFAVAVFSAAAAFILCWVPSRIKTVKVDFDGEVQTVHTALCDPSYILESLGITPGRDDVVTCLGFEHCGFFGNYGETSAEINIRSAFDIDIAAHRHR